VLAFFQHINGSGQQGLVETVAERLAEAVGMIVDQRTAWLMIDAGNRWPW
jgi:hypothetical protein